MVQKLNPGESLCFVLFVFLGDNRRKQHFLIEEECHGQNKLICFIIAIANLFDNKASFIKPDPLSNVLLDIKK